jgi:AraC-like DNA-binding protein
LNLVTAGHGTFGVGSDVIEGKAGDLFYWHPGQDHELLDASPDFDLFVIGLTPELSARVLGDDKTHAARGPLRLTVPARTLVKVEPLCAVQWESADISVAERLIGDLWREAQAMRASSTPDAHPLTRRALKVLARSPDLDRDAISQVAGGCSSELSRQFRRDMGLTLTDYRTRLRILRFIETVDGGAHNLLSASLAAGFGSYSQCHRAFRAILGQAPNAFSAQSATRARMEDLFEPFSPALVDRGDRGVAQRGESRP